MNHILESGVLTSLRDGTPLGDAVQGTFAKILMYFTAIADVWSLTESERVVVVGAPDAATYKTWIEDAIRGAPLALPKASTLQLAAVLSMHYTGGPDAGAEIRYAIAKGQFGEKIGGFIDGLIKLEKEIRKESRRSR